ncbi:MAG: DUF2892 domain-containing protein [Chloroflexi bacterium]|nr:DUF2892 domain-containing protein [Chloroflexota bacterium]
MFAKNMGTVDRAVRVVLGIAMLSALFVVEGPARFAGLVGIIPLLTGVVGSCPLYTLLGLNTCPGRNCAR